MPTLDPRVDAYLAQAPAFAQPLLAHLRAQVHAACPEAVETMKWSFPHFEYQGRILCSMAAFKVHCAFGFWLGELLEIDGKSKEAMGHFGRLTDVAQLPKPKHLQALIREAMRLTEAGAKPPSREKSPKPAAEVPEDLAAALAAAPAAQAAFDGFPPSARRDYIEWLTEAKTAATRAKRLAQAVEWMGEGKRRNWKYQGC